MEMSLWQNSGIIGEPDLPWLLTLRRCNEHERRWIAEQQGTWNRTEMTGSKSRVLLKGALRRWLTSRCYNGHYLCLASVVAWNSISTKRVAFCSEQHSKTVISAALYKFWFLVNAFQDGRCAKIPGKVFEHDLQKFKGRQSSDDFGLEGWPFNFDVSVRLRKTDRHTQSDTPVVN